MGKDAKILTGIGVLTVIVVIVAAFTIGNKPGPAEERKVLGESQAKILIRKDTHMIKGENAKVTIVEFGDFQCPACGVAHSVTKQISEEFKGKINFAFREFPLKMHKNGYLSALAAESAGGQGKFWQMYDKLYENQDEWSENNNAIEDFVKYAKQIGIDADKFRRDVDNKVYDKIIQDDTNDGNQLGITATPTFFINGRVFSGSLKYDDFKSEIESELKK